MSKKLRDAFICPFCQSEKIKKRTKDLWINGVCFDGGDHFYECDDGHQFDHPEHILVEEEQ